MSLFPLLYMFFVPGCSDKERQPSANTSSSTKHHPTIVDDHPYHTEHTCPSRLRPTLDPRFSVQCTTLLTLVAASAPPPLIGQHRPLLNKSTAAVHPRRCRLRLGVVRLQPGIISSQSPALLDVTAFLRSVKPPRFPEQQRLLWLHPLLLAARRRRRPLPPPSSQ